MFFSAQNCFKSLELCIMHRIISGVFHGSLKRLSPHCLFRHNSCCENFLNTTFWAANSWQTVKSKLVNKVRLYNTDVLVLRAGFLPVMESVNVQFNLLCNVFHFQFFVWPFWAAVELKWRFYYFVYPHLNECGGQNNIQTWNSEIRATAVKEPMTVCVCVCVCECVCIGGLWEAFSGLIPQVFIVLIWQSTLSFFH